MINFLKYTLITLFSIVLLSSCGKDDEFDPVGTWALVALSTSGCTDDEVNNLTFSFSDEDGLCVDQDGQTLCVDITFTFKADGTVDTDSRFVIDTGGIRLSETDMDSGTWTYLDGVLEICFDGDCESINISGSSDRISLSQYDDDLECTFSISIERQ